MKATITLMVVFLAALTSNSAFADSVKCQFNGANLEASLENADNLDQNEMNTWINIKKVALRENAVRICRSICNAEVESLEIKGSGQPVLRSSPLCEWRGGCVYGTKLVATATFSCFPSE